MCNTTVTVAQAQSLGSLKMTNGIDANTRKAQRKHMIRFMSVHLLENSNSGEAVPVQPLEMSDHASISVRGKTTMRAVTSTPPDFPIKLQRLHCN